MDEIHLFDEAEGKFYRPRQLRENLNAPGTRPNPTTATVEDVRCCVEQLLETPPCTRSEYMNMSAVRSEAVAEYCRDHTLPNPLEVTSVSCIPFEKRLGCPLEWAALETEIKLTTVEKIIEKVGERIGDFHFSNFALRKKGVRKERINIVDALLGTAGIHRDPDTGALSESTKPIECDTGIAQEDRV